MSLHPGPGGIVWVRHYFRDSSGVFSVRHYIRDSSGISILRVRNKRKKERKKKRKPCSFYWYITFHLDSWRAWSQRCESFLNRIWMRMCTWAWANLLWVSTKTTSKRWARKHSGTAERRLETRAWGRGWPFRRLATISLWQQIISVELKLRGEGCRFFVLL